MKHALISLSLMACAMNAFAETLAAPAASACKTLGAEAQVFLDNLILDMLDPASQFSHLNYLGEPEMAEVRGLDMERLRTDWGNLCRYRDDNLSLQNGNPPEVVFLGDSITEFWSIGDPELFAPSFVNRGISGQTSSQMLVRFWADVVALKPTAVHVMAGTNDMAENTGYVSDDAYRANIKAIVTLAHSQGIEVILASIPPAGYFGWRPELKPAERIAVLNEWLETYAEEVGAVYVDYHILLSTDGQSMSENFTHDGVHPHRVGYAAIRDAARGALDAAIRKSDAP